MKIRKSNRNILLVCAALLCFPIMVYTFGIVAYYRTFLVHETTKTTGRIVKYAPEEHDTISYEYSVSGIPLAGKDTRPIKAEDARVGEAIIVYYVKDHPEDSVLRSPSVEFRSMVIGFTIIIFISFTLMYSSMRFSKTVANLMFLEDQSGASPTACDRGGFV